MKYDVATHSETPMGCYRHSYKCVWCADQKRSWWYDPQTKKPMYALCEHCPDDRDTDDNKHGPEFKKACAWFRKTPVPTKPFNLYPWKPIDNPAVLWKRLKEDLASDNFYTRERLVDDMTALYKAFNTIDEDF